MNNNIDQLKTEVDGIKKSLNELKNDVSLSEEEKKNKAEELKSQAETTKQRIQTEIDALKDKTDDESKRQKEEAETLLNSFNEIMSLYNSILNKGRESTSPTTTQETTPSTTTQEQKEEKGFFGKTKDWVGEQWSDVWNGDKRKEQPGKNLLRTAGFVATGVGAVALAYKGVKKLWNRAFGDDEEGEESEESESKSKKKDKKSFWDGSIGKFIKGAGAVLGVGTGVYYVAHGLYTKNRGLNDLFDWERGKKLEFDAAMEYCKGAIANQDNKEGMSYGMDLKYHEDTGEIEAYGERIKIDKNKRKIVGVGLGEVEFSKYEHMINAAILIAYLKKNYSGKCVNNNPFYLTGDWQGDINVNAGGGNEEAVDGTGNGGRIVGVTAGGIAGILTGIFGGLQAGVAVTSIGCAGGYMLGSAYDHNNIMNDHMPELDNEFGKKSLGAYLNSMDCRKSRNQAQEDITESPIKDKVWECIDEIQRENPDLPSRGGRRQFDMIQDPNDNDKYTIKVYGREIAAEVKGTDGNEKIKILGISGGNPVIKTDMSKGNISDLELPLKEGIYMTCLLGFLLDNFHHKGNEYPRFKYDWKAVKLITTGFGLWGNNNGIYFSDSGINTLALTGEKFEQRMPTLFNANHGERFLKFLNDGIMDEDNIPIWKEAD